MIETERLLLREYTIDDFDALYEIMSDAETMQHYPAPFDDQNCEYGEISKSKFGSGVVQ